MSNSGSFFSRRREKFYEQETRFIIDKINRKNKAPYLFFLTRFSLSKKGETLKVYLNFFNKKNENKKLAEINQIYPKLIKKEMAISKKFSYLPTVIFVIDNN
jgi:ribosome-binding factor A